MDDKPFLIVDLSDLKDSDIDNLLRFKKDNFDTESLMKYAEEIVYTSELDKSIRELLKNPSDEFIRFLIRDFSNSRITTNVIERFRPLVKKAISNAVLDIVSKGLYQQDNNTPIEENPSTETESDNAIAEDAPTNNESIKRKYIVTTQEELEAFELIKSILIKNNKSVENLNYKDTTYYFSLYIGSITKWFIRLNLDSNNKNIMTKLSIDEANTLASGFVVDAAPKGIAESRIYINSINDLNNLESLIIKCYEQVQN